MRAMMSNKLNLAGKVFNKWTVLHENGRYRTKTRVCDVLWRCRCTCGFERDVRTFHLTNGYSKQCRKCGDVSSRLKRKVTFATDTLNYQWWNRYVIEGAKKRGLAVSVSMDEAAALFDTQNKRCALSGLPIKFPSGRKDATATASLDRIDSAKAYVVGNIQWVHKWVNIMKNDHTQEEFVHLCTLVAKHSKLINAREARMVQASVF